MRLRRPFLTFLAVVALLVGAVISFIHSARFAAIAKRVIAKQVPRDSGLETDFKELRVQLFPPGVAVTFPRLEVKKGNKLNLPVGTKISAARLELRFYPLQMFSGKIRVNEVSLVQGDVEIQLPGEDPRKARSNSKVELNWKDLVKVRLDALSFEDSSFKLRLPDEGGVLDFNARNLVLRQFLEEEPEFEISAEISDFRAALKGKTDLPQRLDELIFNLHVNSRQTKIGKLLLVDRSSGRTNSLEVSGNIMGDLLHPKALILGADVKLQGDLKRLLEVARYDGAYQGELSFEGKLKADLLKLPRIIKAEGKIEGSSLQLGAWKVDKLKSKIQSNENLAGFGLGIRFDNLEIISSEVERLNGVPGTGGKIAISTFQIPLEEILQKRKAVEINAPLELTRAHLHWLAAPVIKDVFGLDLRASGPVAVKASRGVGRKDWEIKAGLGLTIHKLQLDNQRLGQKKSLARVLLTPEFKVAGDVVIDSGALRPQGLHVDLPRTSLEVGGKVDFKQGYDLVARGDADLEDLVVLGENKVEGAGPLEVRVHGPSSDVLIDFDADLSDAVYLGLNLGDLKGRITYDDGPSRLLFKKVKLLQGQTNYVGDGSIDFGGQEKIDLAFDFGDEATPGNVQDLNQIFENLTEDLWWFPHSATGAVQGTARITGGLRLDQLMVKSTLAGTNWEWLRERFRTASFSFGFDKGRYLIENMKFLKKQGQISADVYYGPDETLSWKLKSEKLQLLDFDNFVRMNVPIRGNLEINSSGDGKIDRLKSMTKVALTDHFVRGTSYPPSMVNWQSANGVVRVDGNLAGKQGLIDARYDMTAATMSTLKMSLNHFDLSPFLCMLNPKLVQDASLAGQVSGDIDFDFKYGHFDIGSGQIVLKEALLQKTSGRLELAKETTLALKGGKMESEEFNFRGSLGEILVRLGARDTNLDGSITGDVDAGMLEFATSEIVRAKGKIGLDLAIAGQLRSPQISGRFDVGSVYAKLQSLDQPLENVSGNLQLRKGVIYVQYLNADLATGRATTTGTIELFTDRVPKLDLRATLVDNKLLIYPFQFVKVRGKLHATGEELPYDVEGDIFIESALSREPVLSQVRERGRRSARYLPAKSASDDSSLSLFNLNIKARAEKAVIVKNDLFDAELKGDLHIINTISTPRILGTAEVIQGKMLFKESGFQIQSAKVEFDNPTVINPKFNLVATTDINSVRVRLYVSGTVSDFKVDLTSDPAMNEQQILSLLALGFSNDDVSRIKPTDRAAVQQSEAASLLLYSLDFNREVQEKTGLRIELQEAVDNQSGQSIFRAQTGAESVASPKIVIKRNIGKRLDLSVGSTVGVGTSIQREMNAEVKVTPGMSVIGVWNAFEGATTQDERTSYGVDLKLQKRFK